VRKDAKIVLCLILLLMVVVVVIWGRSPAPDEQLAVTTPEEPTTEVVTSPPPPSPPPPTPAPTSPTTAQHSRPPDTLAVETTPPELVGPDGLFPPEPAMMNHLEGAATATVQHQPEPTQPAAITQETTPTPKPTPETQNPKPKTEPPKPKTHIVVKGDSYIRLARRYYNDENKWRVIMEANKTPPEKLYVGQKLIIPPLEATATPAQKPTTQPTAEKPTAPAPEAKSKTYVVGKGESFYSIARKVYRDPTLWKKLYAHNRSRLPKPDDPSSLMAGTIIELPKLASN